MAEVLARPKFDRYVTLDERLAFLAQLARTVQFVPIRETVRACRDPRDDKLLDVAVNGTADGLVTGDADLLALHPFQGMPILPPAAWLSRVGQN